ncbi:MAG: glycosyltransferase family 39 protein [Lachnospiraceae bacterium]|nr:glycosyltransferase family 39 protein [Lachnospiraceae bacterium]
MEKKPGIIRIISAAAVLLIMGAVLFLLGRPAGDRMQTEEKRPPLFDSPSYVDLKEGGELFLWLTAREDAVIGGFSAVLVNLDPEGKGTLTLTLSDPETEAVWTAGIPEADLKTGEWCGIASETGEAFSVKAGNSYLLKIAAEDFSPSFICTQTEATNRSLPFDEAVFTSEEAFRNGTALDCGISLGAVLVLGKTLTYGDIFYHSRIIAVLLALCASALLLFGPGRCLSALKKIPFERFLTGFGNEIFLVILFVTVCLSIRVNGYLDAINITSDSAGYLREAVNLAAGKGFHYDALAGYPESWFANWPILYPALIALIMKITGTEVYLASKLLSMALIFLLILILRIVFKKDAWFCSLCILNTGVLLLSWYSWSELPFIIFLVLFSVALSGILTKKEDEKKGAGRYLFLGATICGAFLTRYFGMFLFGVMGIVILILMGGNLKKKGSLSGKETGKKGKLILKTVFGGKVTGLILTSFFSGMFCLSYLIMNRIKNGMPSGVSRSMWWDDYGSLTNDLIGSLLTEFFHIFHLETPEYITKLSFDKSALLVMGILILLSFLIFRIVKPGTRASIFILTGTVYYAMFIVIRYFSSMDTFYYRFFAPATYLITLGIADALRSIYGKEAKTVYRALGIGVAAVLAVCSFSMILDHILKTDVPYYEIIQASWDHDYEEIPEKSAVIFSTLDYRSSFYRPDVIEGTIDPSDTMDTLRERYHGSSCLCILSSDAEAMIGSGIYEKTVHEALAGAFDPEKKYTVIGLD